jgi:hypothetical protein
LHTTIIIIIRIIIINLCPEARRPRPGSLASLVVKWPFGQGDMQGGRFAACCSFFALLLLHFPGSFAGFPP